MKEELKRKSKNNGILNDIIYIMKHSQKHETLIYLVWIIIIIYIIMGIYGLFNIYNNELLKNFFLVYLILFLFGFIMPLELLAIYYKIGGKKDEK